MIKKLAKETTLYGLVGVFSAFSGFVLTPFYTRFFTPEQYGTLDLLISTGMILAILTGNWIDSGLSRDFYRLGADGQGSQLIGTALVSSIGVVLVAISFFGLVFHYGLDGYADIRWIHVIPLLLTLFPRRLHALAMHLLRLQHELKQFLIVAVGNIVASAVFSIVAVAWFDGGISGILWSFFISRLIFAIVGIFILRGTIRFQWNSRLFSDIATFGLPLLPSFLSQWVQTYAARIILVSALAMSEVGIFSLALKIASFVSIFLLAFNQAWIPMYNEMLDDDDSGIKYSRLLNYYLTGMFIVCANVGVFAWVLTLIFATPAYADATPIIAFLAMGTMWDGALKIIDAGLSKVRKTYLTGISISIGWTINLFCLWLWVESFGIEVAGVSYLLGTISIAAIVLITSQRMYYIPYDSTFIICIGLFSIGLPMLNLFTYPDTSSPTWGQALVEHTLLQASVASICLVFAISYGLRNENKTEIIRRFVPEKFRLGW